MTASQPIRCLLSLIQTASHHKTESVLEVQGLGANFKLV